MQNKTGRTARISFYSENCTDFQVTLAEKSVSAYKPIKLATYKFEQCELYFFLVKVFKFFFCCNNNFDNVEPRGHLAYREKLYLRHKEALPAAMLLLSPLAPPKALPRVPVIISILPRRIFIAGQRTSSANNGPGSSLQL
jgi:hypothetical protein